MESVNFFTYPSARQGMEISARIYHPQASPRGIIQLVHGMCEYVARYDETINFLCGQGYIVCGNDHLGHGDTARINHEQQGWFGGWDSTRMLVKDVHRLTVYMRQQYPELPLIMVCHSMGSFIGRLCIGLFPKDYDGAVVLGTAGPRAAAELGRNMAMLVGQFRGDRYISKAINQMVTRNNLSGLERALTPFDWISRDRKVVDAYIADPDCNFIFTVSAFKDLFTLMKECNNPAWYKAVPRNFPMLLASGDHDPVGDFGNGVRRVYRGLDAAGCDKVEMILYTGARHELHNELCREDFLKDMAAWIERVLSDRADGKGEQAHGA